MINRKDYMANEIVYWSDITSPSLKAINLELTNHCNYRCSFCMNPKSNFRKKGNISSGLVDKIINELDQNVNIFICGIGEPSLHPDFISILGRLSEKFKKMRIVTNGFLFRSDELIDAVLSSALQKITLSLDYVDPVQYNREKDGSLDEVIGFLKRFLERRRRSRLKPILQVNYLYEKGKSDYIAAFDFVRAIVDEPWEFYIRKMKNLAGQVEVDEETDEEFLGKILKGIAGGKLIVENWNDCLKHTNFKTQHPKICRHIYDYYMLTWNGDVVPCCVDFNANNVLFNVLKEGLDLNTLFHSERYRTFRERMERLDYSISPWCAKCNDYHKNVIREYPSSGEKPGK